MVVIFLWGEGEREVWWLIFQIHYALLWQHIPFVSLKILFSDKNYLRILPLGRICLFFPVPKEEGDHEVGF